MKHPTTTPAIELRPIPAQAATTRIGKIRRPRLRLLGVCATLLCLAPLVTGEARGADCGTSYQIDHGDASCLSASWENLPLSVSWTAQNECANYGDVTALVHIHNASQQTRDLTDGTVWRGEQQTTTVDGISVMGVSCCIDESDLCKKSQVEADASGEIDHYDSSDNSWTTASVGTHRERYEYCEDDSDSIYCTNDPEGDAFSAPLLCGGEQCSVSHCLSNWQLSDAHPECRGDAVAFDDSVIFSPMCAVAADCLTDDGSNYASASGTASPWDMDDMKNCGDGIIATRC